MNPEDNNPLTNSGVPNLGAPGSAGMPDMSNLNAPTSTSSTTGASTTGSASTTDEPAHSNPFASIAEEHLTPAAPVPGSIGSVTSVPPASSSDLSMSSAYSAPSSPAVTTSAMPSLGTAPATAPTPTDASAPSVSAAPTAPYNPFAQSTAPTATGSTSTVGAASPITTHEPTAAPTAAGLSHSAPTMPASPLAPASAPTMAPPVQPTAAPKAKSGDKKPANPLILLLALVAAIGIVAAVVFAVLYFGAVNNPKVVYVPSVSEDESNSAMDVLVCSRQADYNYLIGYDHEVLGTEEISLTYVDDALSSIAIETNATFDNENDANTAKDNYINATPTRETIVANYTINGGTMHTTLEVAEGSTLSQADAMNMIYGEGIEQDLSMSSVQTHYQNLGFTCNHE